MESLTITLGDKCKHSNGWYTTIPKRWSFKNIDVFCCSDCCSIIEYEKLVKELEKATQ